MKRIKEKIHIIATRPITWIMVFSAIIFAVGITWGLPNTETWQSDSLAPFHPLMGLTKLFSFGYFNKYPLVHQVILAVLNIPVVITALVKSNPLEGFQISRFVMLIRTADYATALILIDRFVSWFMGLGIVYLVYRSAKEIFTERAAVFATLIVSLNMILNHYSHIAKVEVPYIFWALAAVYKLILILKHERTRDYIHCALFICLSFGTKDQGYAFFVIPLVLYLLVYQVINREEGTPIRKVVFRKNMVIFAAVFIVMTVLVENLVLNREGFMLRFRHLTGDGFVRSMGYAVTPLGILTLLIDNLGHTMKYIVGIPFTLLSLGGIFTVFKRHFKERNTLLMQIIFFTAGLSYYIFFIQVIRQCNARFILPVSIFMSIYGGWFLDYLYGKYISGWKRHLVTAFLILGVIHGLYNTLSVNANFLLDTRYRAEAWMNDHIQEGSRIEYYSYLHYLPRFPEGTSHYRVKEDVLGIEKRRPDYIVLTSHYYPRYIIMETTSKGRIQSLRNRRLIHSEFADFYARLFRDDLNYRLEKRFDMDIPFFWKGNYSRMSPDHVLIYKRVGRPSRDAGAAGRGP